MPATGSGRWVLVVPVKDGEVAKSRLAGFAGKLRPDLARAMAADCVEAALGSTLVEAVVVVTDDTLAAAGFRDMGATVLPDEPRAGLNPALRHGTQVALASARGCRIGALSADLPALRSGELSAALPAAPPGRGFVAGAAGRGTPMLLAASGAPLDPAFGLDSAAAHRASGAAEIELATLPSLRTDVDTEADLRAAERLGLGPRTRLVLARLPRLGASSATTD